MIYPQIIKILAETNNCKVNQSDYNHSKLLEELLELSEVLIKRINKIPEKQPPIEKLIEELGDVSLRIDVLLLQLDIVGEVYKRKEEKAAQLYEYYEQGKYKGGI